MKIILNRHITMCKPLQRGYSLCLELKMLDRIKIEYELVKYFHHVKTHSIISQH